MPHPVKYPWSSSKSYFNDSLSCGLHDIKELGTRRYRELFKTRLKLPSGYLFDESGVIVPENYIAKIEVERLYRNESSYYHYLMRRVENLVEDGGGTVASRQPVLPDHIISEGLSAILANLNVRDFGELPAKMRENVVNDLKYRYNITNMKQLSRILPDVRDGTDEHTHRR